MTIWKEGNGGIRTNNIVKLRLSNIIMFSLLFYGFKGGEVMFLDVTWLERPKLFISSTMDKMTKTTRKEMISKLEERGYEVVAFESDDFPYANDTSTNVIEETINAVATANLFVLIVDENYGTIVDNQSVIHKEYQRAKELRLPIFVFIQRDVWDCYKNKKVGSDGLIKSTEHYEFIQELAEYKLSDYETATDCFEHIKKQLLKFLGGTLKFSAKANWLWNENYTRGIEKKAKEIWIITPDFLWDYDDEQFREIVVRNITERGCNYRYIYRDSSDNREKRNEMERYYKQAFLEQGKDIQKLNEQVQFLPVQPDEFYWACEQIIFDPLTSSERAIMVDVMDVRDRTLKFNIEIGRGKRVVFRNQFIGYWNNSPINQKNKIDLTRY